MSALRPGRSNQTGPNQMNREASARGNSEALICFAVAEEAKPFRRLLGAALGADVLVTGIGEKNSIAALSAWFNAHPEPPPFVFTCGFAGGLNRELKRGTVLFQSDTPRLAAALNGAGARQGSFTTSERIITTALEKRALHESSRADAVEMESGAIVRECRKRALPVAIVRVILDTADEDLPLDFNQFMTPDLKMNYTKLALSTLTRPQKILELVKFGKRAAEAGEALAHTLRLALEELNRSSR